MNKRPDQSLSGTNPPDEHPDWPISEWVADVSLGFTLLGYWDWVENILTTAAKEAQDGN